MQLDFFGYLRTEQGSDRLRTMRSCWLEILKDVRPQISGVVRFQISEDSLLALYSHISCFSETLVHQHNKGSNPEHTLLLGDFTF